MFRVQNVNYDIDMMTFLYDLKNSLTQDGVFLLDTIKQTGDNILFTCPFHKEGHEHKPSCGISMQDKYTSSGKLIPAGTVHCFTCNYISSIDKFISNCYNKQDMGIFGTEWLKQHYKYSLVDTDRHFKVEFSRGVKHKIDYPTINDKILDNYSYYHDYMYKRHLDDRVINLFDIGYDKATNSITIPVKDLQGNVKWIQKRRINYKYYHIPDGIKKTDFLLGAYECLKYNKNNEPIYVVESPFNMLTLWKYKKFAVCLFGTGGGAQYDLLNMLPFRHLIIALDNDIAGINGEEKLLNHLGNTKLLDKLIYNPLDTRDINELDKDVLKLKVKPLNY